MHFCSTKAAKQAVENMKAVRDDLTVKSEEGAAYASKELACQTASWIFYFVELILFLLKAESKSLTWVKLNDFA